MKHFWHLKDYADSEFLGRDSVKIPEADKVTRLIEKDLLCRCGHGKHIHADRSAFLLYFNGENDEPGCCHCSCKQFTLANNLDVVMALDEARKKDEEKK